MIILEKLCGRDSEILIRNKEEFFRSITQGTILTYIGLHILDKVVDIPLTQRIYVDSSILASFLKVERINVDNSGLLPELIEAYAKFLVIGGSVVENSKFINRLKQSYPSKNFYGLSGYNVDIERAKELAVDVDITFLSMGNPLQERFAEVLLPYAKGIICCGAMVSQFNSGDFYPRIFVTLNLRWVFRLYKEQVARGRFLKSVRNLLIMYLWRLKFLCIKVFGK